MVMDTEPWQLSLESIFEVTVIGFTGATAAASNKQLRVQNNKSNICKDCFRQNTRTRRIPNVRARKKSNKLKETSS
jgi:hypothetical protein